MKVYLTANRSVREHNLYATLLAHYLHLLSTVSISLTIAGYEYSCTIRDTFAPRTTACVLIYHYQCNCSMDASLSFFFKPHSLFSLLSHPSEMPCCRMLLPSRRRIPRDIDHIIFPKRWEKRETRHTGIKFTTNSPRIVQQTND